MVEFTVISFLDDMNLSFSIASICNNNGFNLIFPGAQDFKNEIHQLDYGVVIIDLENKSYDPFILAESFNRGTVFPIVGYLDQMKKRIKSQAHKSGVDIVLTRDTLLRNLDTILNQVVKEIEKHSKSEK